MSTFLINFCVLYFWNIHILLAHPVNEQKPRIKNISDMFRPISYDFPTAFLRFRMISYDFARMCAFPEDLFNLAGTVGGHNVRIATDDPVGDRKVS